MENIYKSICQLVPERSSTETEEKPEGSVLLQLESSWIVHWLKLLPH